MATKLQIVNAALTAIGKATITQAELDAGTVEAARRSSAVYDIAREETLRGHAWGFATKILELTECDDSVTVLNWTYVYLYPSDCLKAWGLFSSSDGTITFDDTVNVTAERQPFKKLLMSGQTLSASIVATGIQTGDAYCPAAWSLVISGTFVGTVKLQKSVDDGVTWSDVGTYTIAGTNTGTVTAPCLLRLNCTAWTSGTIVCALTVTDYLVLAANVNPAYLEYVIDQDDEAFFDAAFVQAMAETLAAKIARPLTGDRQIEADKKQDAFLALDRAKADDAKEQFQTPDSEAGNPYYSAR